MSSSPDNVPAITWRLDAARAAIIGIVALAARLIVAILVPDSMPVADMQEYWERAVYIAQHGRLYDNSWRMPGYPILLALAFGVGSGPSLLAARLANASMGAVTALLAYWLARRSARPNAALAAGLIVALYPSFLIYTALFATEAIVGLPLLAALIAVSYGTRRAAAIAGVCVGLTILTRPAGIALLPAVLVAAACRRDLDTRIRWSFVSPAIVAVTFLVTMTPWWVHNAGLHGRFVPLDTTGGVNLLIGNSAGATGAWKWSEVSRLRVDELRGVDPTTPAGSDRAIAMAFAHMRAYPSEAVRLLPAKVAGLLAIEGREHAYLYSVGYFGSRSAPVVWTWGLAVASAFPLLLGCAVLGCAMRHGVAESVLLPCVVFLAASLVMHLISFGDPRFHLPLVPVLAVLTTGLARLPWGFVRWRVAMALMLLLCLTVPWSTQFARSWTTLTRLSAPDGSSARLPFDDLL